MGTSALLRNLALAVAALALGLTCSDALASVHHEKGLTLHEATNTAPRHGLHRAVSVSHGAPGYQGPDGSGYRWPGYIYVPGKGIVGESCNLPTSACPNSERDVQ
jgi:hypothetical protein